MPVSGTLTYRTEIEGVTFSNETVPCSRWPVDEIEVETPDHEDDDRMHPLLIRAHIQEVEASKEEILLRTNRIVEDLIDRLAFVDKCYIEDPEMVGSSLQDEEDDAAVTVRETLGELRVRARATVERSPENTRDMLRQVVTGKKATHPHYEAFRLALRTDNVMQQYMGLYRILHGLLGAQKAVDDFARVQLEDVEESISPQTGKPETVFTRLRNEVGHYREHEHDADVDLRETVQEMEAHLGKLKDLVWTTINREGAD